jgi:hypothetical protein
VVATKKRYINVFFEERQIDAIDAFRYKNKIPTRTEAILRLVDYALSGNPKIAPVPRKET